MFLIFFFSSHFLIKKIKNIRQLGKKIANPDPIKTAILHKDLI